MKILVPILVLLLAMLGTFVIIGAVIAISVIDAVEGLIYGKAKDRIKRFDARVKSIKTDDK